MGVGNERSEHQACPDCSSCSANWSNQTFFSLSRLNERIAELCHDRNDRKMRLYGESRRQLFERIERTARAESAGALALANGLRGLRPIAPTRESTHMA
jgi:hypothetical protein